MDKQTKETQFRKTIAAFKEYPKTTKMVAVETGIQRCNITRYVATLEKRNQISVVKQEPCKITKHKAKYYSTDPEYFQMDTQNELFPSGSNNGYKKVKQVEGGKNGF